MLNVKAERRQWPLVAAIAGIVLIAFIPAFIAKIKTPDGWLWTGIFSRNTADYNGYLSIVEEVRQGAWRTHNLFTAEPHPAFQIRPFYLLLGLLGRSLPAVSSIALMEIGRMIAIVWFLVVLMKLAGRIYGDPYEKLIVLFTVTFGSGLGWLHLTPDPPDLRIVETSTFLALLSPPLYCESLALFAGILYCLDAAFSAKAESCRLRYSLLAALQAILLGLDRPFSLAPLISAVCVSATLFLFRMRSAPRQLLLPAAAFTAGAGAILLHQILTIRSIPVYAAWNHQHVLPTPGVLRILLAFGLLIPFAVAGVRALSHIRPYLTTLLCCYAVVSFSFSRFPLQYQERFLEGLPLCIGLLASCGAVAVLRRIKPGMKRLLAACALIFLLIPSTITGIFRDVEALERKTAPQYLPAGMIEAMRVLKSIAPPRDAILSAQSSGNFIAAYAGRPVVLGQQVQTANFFVKRQLVASIFNSDAASTACRQLVRESNAAFLFWGPEERAQSRGRFNPNNAAYFHSVYSNLMVTIFRIER